MEAPSNYKDPAKIQEYRQKEWEKELTKMSLHPLTGQIICLSMKVDDNTPTTLHGTNEKEIVTEFARLFGTVTKLTQPVIVTYNGKAFDLPFIILACARHGVYSGLTNPRYSRDHYVDMYEYLSSYGVFKRGTLTDWANRLGVELPIGKGEDIGNWFKLGDWQSIVTHCRSNVESTYGIFLKIRAVDTHISYEV